MTGRLGKAAAARLFQELGLEGLPARVYAPDERPSQDQLEMDFGPDASLMLRTAASTEVRDLPRLAGATTTTAAGWTRQLADGLSVIVQPYDEVVFSVELAVYPSGVRVVELVAGIWELDTIAVPAHVRVDTDGSMMAWFPLGDQPAKFHSSTRGYTLRLAHIEDWQVASTLQWIESHRRALDQLSRRLGRGFGMKLHYAARWGLSPQNLRSGLPDLITQGPVRAEPADLVRVSSVTDEIPTCGEVVLVDVAVAREDYASLEHFIDRLLAAGIREVWVRSGLLSHLAISLREAGLDVHRAEESA